MARNSPCIGIVTSPGRDAHDEEDRLALVKLFTQSCGGSTKKEDKPNDRFNQALKFIIHNFLIPLTLNYPDSSSAGLTDTGSLLTDRGGSCL